MPDLYIAFIARSTLYSSPGGDTVQIDMTARYLRLLDIAVDIFTTDQPIPYDRYDLFHYFNLIRPADILYHIRRTDKPFVVSPIFVDYSEYEQTQRRGLSGIISKLAGSWGTEYLKCLLRYLKNGERIRSSYYLLHGHKRAMQYVLDHCALLLPNSASEYRRLCHSFRYSGPYRVVPCAADLATFHTGNAVREADLVLCVGRIEGRKNQLALIRALKDSKFRLVLIGSPSPNHQAYYQACKAAAGPGVSFIAHTSQEELRHWYQQAKVHVLPSWFETAGLSSLEAACCGCNIVVGDKGDVRDYFGNDAWYCDPASEHNIRTAVEKAAAAPSGTALQQRILQQHNWAEAARQTLSGYQSLFAATAEQATTSTRLST